ncbi:D-amino-acid transaminase [Alkalicoccus daliensis]|uniref:D-alanine aminotransferase n=1 Tax=Alkalicoccus daliensis TaxID=745820 RepID=A0A1H0CKP4_9BACI|nr:D-amino-acid transaminase [Alkalicoccus daliensis]SDN58423.1 D-alanine transaminase [Alkalicoccus daliensis]
MPEIAFYQDRFVDVDEAVIPIQERGHQFGDGIYEVIRIYDGKPFTMPEHMARLEKSLAAIKMPLPYPIEEIERIALEALDKSGLKEAEIYMQITRGIFLRQHQFPEPSSPVISIVVKNARTVSEEKRAAGVPVITTEDVRWKLCHIKSLNLLPNVMAKQEAYEAGAHEAVFVEKGIVKEGSSTNIFCVKDGVVQTHPATNGILHGITRQVVLDLADELGIPVEERTFSLAELKNAEEVFLTSTTMEVLKVSSVDGEKLSEERTVIDQLYTAFQERKQMAKKAL